MKVLVATNELLHERGEPALAPQHGGEKAADHEEQRHAETVDRGEEDVEAPVMPVVVDRPTRVGHIRQRGVQPDPQQHRRRPERVEIVAAVEERVSGR